MYLFVDFETAFSSQEKYDLKHIPLTAYIQSEKFKVFGMGVAVDDTAAQWVDGDDIEGFFEGFPWPQTTLISHNLKFDGAILAWKYGIKPKQYIDTVSLARAVLGATQAQFSLASLAQRFGFAPKGNLNTDGKTILTADEEKALAAYCLHDVELCKAIFDKLMPLFPANQLKAMDWATRCFIAPALEIDTEAAARVQKEIAERKEKVLATCGATKEVLASNKKFPELLVSLGYAVPMKVNKKGLEIPALASTDDQLKQMAQADDERLRLLAQGRLEVKKTMEVSRAEKLIELGKVWKKYPWDIKFSGALQTHRFSGGDGAGGNPQNFPRESGLREAICAPEGYKVVVGDFKNIELRILAYLANEPHLISAIVGGKDPYCDFASKIYKRPITKQDKKERHVGKAAVLGLGYSMGVDKFVKSAATAGINLDRGTAATIVKLYRNYYARVPAFWQICERVIEKLAGDVPGVFPTWSRLKLKHEAIELPSGLLIQFPGLVKRLNEKGKEEWTYKKFHSRKTETDEAKLYGGKLTENLCQSLAGEICKLAIERLVEKGWMPNGQVHDEILMVVPNDRTEEAKQAMRSAMETAPSWWPQIRLGADIGAGQNWKEAKSI